MTVGRTPQVPNRHSRAGGNLVNSALRTEALGAGTRRGETTGGVHADLRAILNGTLQRVCWLLDSRLRGNDGEMATLVSVKLSAAI